MKSFSLVIVSFALVCAGCLSDDAPDARLWTVDPICDELPSQVVASEGSERPAFGTTRMGLVFVDAPYDKSPFVVRRADGSVAFDQYNLFASSPSSLLQASVRARLNSDTRFGSVVGTSSVAGADAQVEVQVTDLSLDCRETGRRIARAAVKLTVIKMGSGPRVVALEGTGTGEADAADGDYTKAFSTAFDAAVSVALRTARSASDMKGE